jgi:hypothetical protein
MPILGIVASSITGKLVTGSFDSIATVVTTAGQTAVTFNSIPSTYRHLQVRGIARANESNPGDGSGIYMRFNGDGGSNYFYNRQYFVKGVANNSGAADGSFSSPYADCGIITSASQPASIYGSLVVDIYDYAVAGKRRVASSNGGFCTTSGSTNQYTHISSLSWADTTAINTVALIVGTGSFAANSTFALYGVKG